MKWLNGAETTLMQQGSQPIPENIPIIEQLLHDHATFQTEIQVIYVIPIQFACQYV